MNAPSRSKVIYKREDALGALFTIVSISPDLSVDQFIQRRSRLHSKSKWDLDVYVSLVIDVLFD